jgi:hypothetical protein
MGSRRRSALLAAVVASVLWSSSGVQAGTHPAGTGIDTAHTASQPDDRAARATESVHYDDTTLVLLASYSVGPAGPDIAPANPDLARDRHLWALVTATLPDEGTATIRQMNVVTDGRDGTLGMVHRSTVDAGSWVLSIDPAEADDVLVDTLVHEYAHMLTLRTDDLTSNAASRNGCAGVRIEIGCARPGSALAAWHDEFWPGVAEPAPSDSRVFVSQYAASSVHEDLAESFMAWTLGQVARPTVAMRERFSFFADRPEFVTARDEILTKLGRAEVSVTGSP